MGLVWEQWAHARREDRGRAIRDAALARPDPPPPPLSPQPPSIGVDEQSNGTKLASSAPTTGI